MKVIIAGSRTIRDAHMVGRAIAESHFAITECVCGEADGPDTLGKYWCTQRGIAIKSFPAKWEEWEGLPAGRIKLRQYANRNAFYNILAGHNRNIDMANYAEALIAITQGNSAGTRNMIALALSRKLKTYVVILNGDGSYRCGVHVGGHDIVELF